MSASTGNQTRVEAPRTFGIQRRPIDTARSRIGFRVRKMGLYYVKGRFRRAQGWVETGPDGALGSGAIEIEAASVTTRIPPRDWHLRTRDFLDVAHHPTISVEVDAAQARDAALDATATFTIRGSSSPVELHGHLDVAGGMTILHLHGTLDRHAFGIRPRQPVEWIVGREVLIDALVALGPPDEPQSKATAA